jgi:hypothetical protein
VHKAEDRTAAVVDGMERLILDVFVVQVVDNQVNTEIPAGPYASGPAIKNTPFM